jgi:hypothetical protein
VRACKILNKTPKKKSLLGRTRNRWMLNCILGNSVGWHELDLFDSKQELWYALMNTIINLGVP